jgi:C-terminal processing protease CtpA/Prc
MAQGLQLFNAADAANEVLHGGSASATSMPVALLITQDVSASDWLPLGLKGAAPNVKIFGPYGTNGAFSTRFQSSYWLGMTTVLATGDTFLPDGRTQAGLGVEPDVVVLPKQSDLVVGVDSVFEAAIAWVRQEMNP